jgi:hypothetical protein
VRFINAKGFAGCVATLALLLTGTASAPHGRVAPFFDERGLQPNSLPRHSSFVALSVAGFTRLSWLSMPLS